MNPQGEKGFQEYLTSQGTVVKPCCWQRQNHICAKCPYHIRTGEEARVPYADFHGIFGFPYGSRAALQTKHLLFYELRSFSGRAVQKGHATNCTAQGSHPESMLFEAGGYLDAVTGTCGNLSGIILYSNYSPCNEAFHCCVSKIYNFLLKYPEIKLCIYFSQLYHTEDSFPTAAWNREALRSLSSLWPQVTLQRLPEGAWPYLLCNFVYGIPRSVLCHLTPPSKTSADQQNPHLTNDVMGTKAYWREASPPGMQAKPAAGQNLRGFYSPSLACQQPFQSTKGSLLPPTSQNHLLLYPGMVLPFQKEHLHPKPKNIVRHLRMPKK
ncbi:putative C-_U-editing enzyme APOBEC-4 [Pogoniulus pusillus]|uniref:putative C->U-editing enzyme APOBEC-4 n=1 Tax=Pogoniulus pusillus TaxID=488313 RepID=UPI0030B95400